MGGAYETDFSTNPMWNAEVVAVAPHEITRGTTPFAIFDEWYFNIRFADPATGITPVLQATPPDSVRFTAAAAAHPGRAETLAWAYDRADGGRSFGFTGGHFHDNWHDSVDAPNAPMQRRLVVNGILWTAHVAVPEAGASVDVDPAIVGKFIGLRD